MTALQYSDAMDAVIDALNDRDFETAKVECIKMAKRQVIELGLHNECANFSELHDHIDANELGFMCEDAVVDVLIACSSQDGWFNFANDVQNAINQWLGDLRTNDDHVDAAERYYGVQ